MKRKLLAIVIPALLASQAVKAEELYNKNSSTLDVYGKIEEKYIDANNSFSPTAKKETVTGDHSTAQVGLKAKTSITDQITGYAQGEFEASLGLPETIKAIKRTKEDRYTLEPSLKTRLGFFGVKWGDGSSLDYGRNYGVVHDISQWTDVLPAFGGDTVSHTDNYMTGRSGNLTTFRNKNMFNHIDGLDFAVQHQGANTDKTSQWNEENRQFNHQNKEGLGLSATYNIGYGLTMGAAYTHSERPDEAIRQGEQKRYSGYSDDGNQANSYTVGMKLNAKNTYLAAMGSMTENMTPYGNERIAAKCQNYEVVAKYNPNGMGFNPSIAYVRMDGQNLNEMWGLPTKQPNGTYNPDEANKDHNLKNYIDVGTSYHFNKDISAYVDYKINLIEKDKNNIINDPKDPNERNEFLDDAEIKYGDQVAVGVSYKF